MYSRYSMYTIFNVYDIQCIRYSRYVSWLPFLIKLRKIIWLINLCETDCLISITISTIITVNFSIRSVNFPIESVNQLISCEFFMLRRYQFLIRFFTVKNWLLPGMNNLFVFIVAVKFQIIKLVFDTYTKIAIFQISRSFNTSFETKHAKKIILRSRTKIWNNADCLPQLNK